MCLAARSQVEYPGFCKESANCFGRKLCLPRDLFALVLFIDLLIRFRLILILYLYVVLLLWGTASRIKGYISSFFKNLKITSIHFIKPFSMESLNPEAASFVPQSHVPLRGQSSSNLHYHYSPPSPMRPSLSASIHAPLTLRRGLSASILVPISQSEEVLCDSIYTPNSPPRSDSSSIHAPCMPPTRGLNASIHAPPTVSPV